MDKYIIVTTTGFGVTDTLFDTIEEAKDAVISLSLMYKQKFDFDLKAKIVTVKEYIDHISGLLIVAETQHIILN